MRTLIRWGLASHSSGWSGTGAANASAQRPARLEVALHQQQPRPQPARPFILTPVLLQFELAELFQRAPRPTRVAAQLLQQRQLMHGIPDHDHHGDVAAFCHGRKMGLGGRRLVPFVVRQPQKILRPALHGRQWLACAPSRCMVVGRLPHLFELALRKVVEAERHQQTQADRDPPYCRTAQSCR